MKKYTAMALVVVLFLLPSTGNSELTRRIVSLDLCSDWLLAKYASRDQVLALSNFILQYPVDWVGEDWPIHNGSLEQILELQPDLVIAGEYNALLLRQRLKELDVQVEVLSLPKNLPQVLEYERHFLSLLGLPASKAATPVKASKAIHPQRLLLLGANGIGTGRNTFEDGVLQHSGWQNYLKDDGYLNLDLEQLVNDPPDAIMWSAPNSAALANQFSGHVALKHSIPAKHWLSSYYWHWQCPGPWTWELIKQLQNSRVQFSSQKDL